MSKKKDRKRSEQPTEPKNDSTSGAAAGPAAESPLPQPLTPERVAAENRRNDLFIVAAVLIAAFLFGFFKINDSDLWLHLRSGWQIDRHGVPENDPFAYTTADQRWINPHWLYDWVLYKLELVESRVRTRGLADEYERLMKLRQVPKYDEKFKDLTKPLANESVAAFDQVMSELKRAADGPDTFVMRRAAEHAAETAESIGLQPPGPSQTGEQPNYTALSRYAGTGGPALIGLETLVVVKSILLVALVGVLLSVRYSGPTTWWAAVVAAITLVAASDRLTVSPEIFSLVLLAIVFWIMHEFQSRRAWAIWLLVPVQVAWVNIDSLFPLGVIVPALVLACGALGRALGRSADEPAPRRPGGSIGAYAAALVAAFVATLANPYGVRIWSLPISWVGDIYGRLTMVPVYFAYMLNRDSQWAKQLLDKGDGLVGHSPDLVPPFSRAYRDNYFSELLGAASCDVPWLPTVTFAVLAVAAASSLVWAAREQRVWRGLVLAAATAMFLVASRYIGVAAIVAGVVLTLNGQEWFLGRFGDQTRMSNRWLAWSQGGRAATIVGLALVAILGMTGRFGAGTKSEFGWGVLWVKFDLSAGKFLRDAKLNDHMVNSVPVQGNLLIWSNYDPDRPATRVFLDGRLALHRGHLDEFESFKRALRDNDRSAWADTLDKLGASHVLLNIYKYADPVTFPKSFDALRDSEEWRLVHLDSTHAILGRSKAGAGDAFAADVARLGEMGVSASEQVYRRHGERLPEPPPPVRAPGFVDWFWRSRDFSANESVLAAHLLNQRFAEIDTTVPGFLVPTENCFLSIRAARQGLAKRRKVSTLGYQSLSEAYYYLYNVEMAQFPVAEAHQLRTMQLICALNQLLAADPKSKFGHVHLAFRYLSTSLNYLDLAAEHLEAAIDMMEEEEATVVVLEGGHIQKFTRDDLKRISERLRIQVERAEGELAQAGAQLAQPFARMNFFLSRGCPGRAIQDLAETIAMSSQASELAPMLANLYIRTGQPGDVDRGAEGELKKIQGAATGLKPGEFEEMYGTVKLLQGDYETAKSFMEKAIAETRHSMAAASLTSASVETRQGALIHVANTSRDLVDDAARQGRLEFHLGMLQLEAGEPNEAVRHFRQALIVREDLIYRPVIAMYLERITGERLEPLPDTDAAPSDEMKPSAVELPPKPAAKPEPEAKDAGKELKIRD